MTGLSQKNNPKTIPLQPHQPQDRHERSIASGMPSGGKASKIS
jgi:hypothetical protein